MDLNYNTMNLPVQSKNSRSISENPDFVREKIFKEIDLGRVAGPFDYPPMMSMASSMLEYLTVQNSGSMKSLCLDQFL
jgi:hypothetical protein